MECIRRDGTVGGQGVVYVGEDASDFLACGQGPRGEGLQFMISWRLRLIFL